MSSAEPRISVLGTSALLFEAPGEMDLPTQQRILALAREAETWPELREAVPGMNNLLLSFVEPPRRLDAIQERLVAAWRAATPLPLGGRVVELPVVYGGEGGPHMADVIAHTGLDLDEVVAIHSAPVYPVYALGSHPGYCYLGGMDARITTPRRKVPVIRIPGGAVALLSDQLRRNRGTKGLAPYHRPAAMAGTAVTVRTRGGDNLAILRCERREEALVLYRSLVAS